MVRRRRIEKQLLFAVIDMCICLWQCFTENSRSFSELECPFFKIVVFRICVFQSL